MRVETNLREVALEDVVSAAKLVEELGFDGLAQSEVRRDPFISLTLAATATNSIRLAPAVAIVFPRSPMIVAYMSHNLQVLSKGRFALGMGTQVKGHIQRRFSTEWGSPGPRLREYILALRAIWDCWQNDTPLNFTGDFYQFTLMTPEFNLGPTGYDPIPIQIGAVNKYLIRTAGELCDGLRVHSFSTPEYIRDVIWPNVLKGARKAGRSLDSFEMIGGGFTATGADEQAVTEAREWVRHRIAWYASTRTYLPVLEHHGWEAINPELRKLIEQKRWDDMKKLVSDEMLDTFCVSGTYDQIAAAARKRIEGLTDTLSFPLPFDATERRPQLAAAVQSLKQLKGADEWRAKAGEVEPA
jgi:probable F420-dependent oxidoreductase